MPKIKSSSEPIVLEGSFKTWTMDKASEILVSEKYDGAIEDMIGSSHNVLNILGHVQNSDMFGGTALILAGDEIELRIGKSGLVQGTSTGMYLSGDGSSWRRAILPSKCDLIVKSRRSAFRRIVTGQDAIRYRVPAMVVRPLRGRS